MSQIFPQIVFDEKQKFLSFEWNTDKEKWLLFQKELRFFLEESGVNLTRCREYDRECERKEIFNFERIEDFLKVKDFLISKIQEIKEVMS
jgi:hypothetical protein